MKTTTPTKEPEPKRPKRKKDQGSTAEREDRSLRRMLMAFLAVLVSASVVLLVLIFILLRPTESESVAQTPSGYPIHVVRSILGFGTKPEELLVSPLSVTYDREGLLWVSDTGNSRVLVFSTGGGLVRKVGEEEGPGKVYSPYGIAADPTRDRVYVADWTAHMVQMYTSNGTYVGHLPADDQKMKVFGANGFSPYDVDVMNGRVVVSSNDGLYFFDSTGHVVARWGSETRGTDPGAFNFPDSFVIDREAGRVYVADTMNRRVVGLDSQGRVLWVSGRPDYNGKIKGFWQLPRSITLNDGKLYVVDTFRFDEKGIGLGHIVVLGTDGALLSEFGRVGTDEASFNFPEQMTVNGDGLWALADRENNRIVLFTLTPIPPPTDLEKELYAKSFSRPEGYTATPAPGEG